jgi:hypothetical protein
MTVRQTNGIPNENMLQWRYLREASRLLLYVDKAYICIFSPMPLGADLRGAALANGFASS